MHKIPQILDCCLDCENKGFTYDKASDAIFICNKCKGSGKSLRNMTNEERIERLENIVESIPVFATGYVVNRG